MPWLERPAAVYTRFEVVLHCIDAPLIQRHDESVYEIWEARIIYSFDAHEALWRVSIIDQLGNRRGRNARIAVPGRHPDLVALAEKHQPEWIPDPSKKRLHLPAEAVWNEAVEAIERVLLDPSGISRVENPYRGE